MIHPATQATLTSILLSGVPGYTQNTPSPPPGLAPIDAQINGVSDCSKAVSPLSSKVSTPSFTVMRLYIVVLKSCLEYLSQFVILDFLLTRILCACVVQQPSTMYSRMSAASLTDKVLTAAHGDSVQEASPHCPSEPLSSKSSQDQGLHYPQLLITRCISTAKNHLLDL